MKASQIRDSYRGCLPKPPLVTWGNIFVWLTGGASLVGLFVALWKPERPAAETLFAVFLVLLALSCLSYTVIRAHKRLHRYAEAVYFYHYVNHTLRDYTAQVVSSDDHDRNLEDLLADVLTAIATCFSIVTGKQCRCCAKDLREDQEIVDAKRDNISAAQAESMSILNRTDVKHTLDKNTDFYKLWHADDGCKRVYLANDLLEDYRYGRYRNSSFEVHGEPQIASFLGHTYVKKWPLPYRSALVLPIRYVSEFKPPKKQDGGGQDENPHWKYWGFLCIDCNGRNVFDHRYAVELGGAFADLLYSLFNELDLAKAAMLDDEQGVTEQVGDKPAI